MSVDPTLVGRSFGPTAPFDVTAEHVAEFAAAIGADYQAGDPAPVTFPIVVAFQAMTALMEDAAVGITLERVVHGEQRFDYSRPVRVGDRLAATLYVDTLRSIGGADIIGTRSTIADADGHLVCTAKATLVYRGPEEAS